MTHADDLPRLAAGQIRDTLRCPRRVVTWLSPEDRPKPPWHDAPFRLRTAVVDALRAAHAVVDGGGAEFATALDPTVPTDLSVEEGIRFRQALIAYADEFGERSEPLHPHAGAPLAKVSSSRDFTLTARADLAFVASDGDGAEVRRVVLRTRPPRLPTQPDDADLALGALLGTPLLVTRLWTVGEPAVASVNVGHDDVTRFRGRVHEAIAAAFTTPQKTVSGWWCTTCPAIARCPAIAQRSVEDVLGDP